MQTHLSVRMQDISFFSINKYIKNREIVIILYLSAYIFDERQGCSYWNDCFEFVMNYLSIKKGT